MQKERRLIGFDLDDIIFNFMGGLVQWHNDVHGTTHTREDYFSFDLHEVWKCDGETARDRVWDFYHSDHHHNVVPIEGSIETLKKIKEDYRLVIITARPQEMEVPIRAWLDQYFEGVFDDVIFTNHFHGVGEKRSKSSVCLELGVAVFVEDALHNAYDVVAIGIPVLLLDTPWNQEEIAAPITRVYSWEDIAMKIKEY